MKKEFSRTVRGKETDRPRENEVDKPRKNSGFADEKRGRGERANRGERVNRGEVTGRGERKNQGEVMGRGEMINREEKKNRGERTSRAGGDIRGRSHDRLAENQDEGRIEGRNPILEALRSGRTIEKLLVAKGSREGSVLEIIKKAKEKRIVIQEVDRRRLDDLSMTEGAHQGVIAFVTPYTYVELEDILDYAASKKQDPFLIVLDEIEDPYNLGSIIRTAECSGAHGLIIPKRRASGLTPIAIKASAGAVEFMPVSRVTNISDTIDLLKKRGLWIAGAHMDGELYKEKDLTGPLALVIGSEGKGLSRLVKEKCDFLIKIPLMGQISSLNASVAAGVLMYEVAGQRRGRD